MQYWINHNGVQMGPVDLEALKDMGLTSSAYVWHEGLTDWVKITQLPELQGLYQMVGTPIEAASQPVEVGQPIEPGVEPELSQPVMAEPSQPVMAEPSQPVMTEPSQPVAPQQPSPEYQPAVQPATPCPPTNLAWAIISTLLCCLPAGVVAIIYAVKVTNKYNAGDIEGANQASETGAWWCIASIILGIVVQPLLSLLPLLGS
ncbi:MAG: CD225/dispanin family protein [Muribaculaceae bacterium]|nr:CD225/dispanin family protein [Muribaculaceae bacterium]